SMYLKPSEQQQKNINDKVKYLHQSGAKIVLVLTRALANTAKMKFKWFEVFKRLEKFLSDNMISISSVEYAVCYFYAKYQHVNADNRLAITRKCLLIADYILAKIFPQASNERYLSIEWKEHKLINLYGQQIFQILSNEFDISVLVPV